MGLDDLYIISTILGLAVFAVGAKALVRYGKTLTSTSGSSIDESTSPQSQTDVGMESSQDSESASQLSVTFSESGKQFPWDTTMECLLDFIESKGIEVDCLCGAGECGSCKTRIIEGEVSYRKEPKINPGEGYCLLCVTVPKSNLVLAK